MNGRMRRVVAVCVMGWVGLTVTGCGPEVPSEAVLAVQTEELGERLLAEIEGVERTQDDIVGHENRYATKTGARTDDDDPRWRQWTAGVTFTPEAELSPREAAERIGALLDDDPQWTFRFVDTPIGGSREYRRSEYGGRWSVSLTYSEEEPPIAQNLSITVVSPTTTRD